MKKFLAMLLAALLVVSMFTFAMAEGGAAEGGAAEGGAAEGGAAEGGAAEGGAAEGGAAEGGAAEGGAAEGGAAEGEGGEEEEDPNYTGTKGNDDGGVNTEYTDCKGLPADNAAHDWKDVTIPASCTGNKVTMKKCAGCGLEKDITEEKKTALGHLWMDENGKVVSEADCVNYGSEILTCSRCGATKTFTTAEGDHKFTAWEVVTKETCVSEGLYKRYCITCGAIATKTVAATGKHVFDHKYVKVRGTCTTYGTYEAKCTMCGKYFTYKDLGDNDATAKADGTIELKIPARGHKWSEGAVQKAVTCQQDGIVYKVCLNKSSSELYEACNDSQTITISKDTMEYNPAVKDTIQKYHKLKFVAETKGENGAKRIGHYECTVDGCTYRSQQVLEYTASANSSSSSSSGSKKPSSSSTNKKGVSIPKTNDSTSNLPYVLIAAAFVGLVALVASKKKVHG